MQNWKQPKQNIDHNFYLTVSFLLLLDVLVDVLLWNVPPDGKWTWLVSIIWTLRLILIVPPASSIALAAKWVLNWLIQFMEGRARIKQSKAKARRFSLEADRLEQENIQIPGLIEWGKQNGSNIKIGSGSIEVSSPLRSIHESYREGVPKDEPNGEVPPEPFTLSDALSDFEPSNSGILVAKSNRGLTILPPDDRMSHVALSVPTGGGKTNLERVIIPQLAKIGHEVYLLDPFYQDRRVNQSTGEVFDYRPIRSHLAGLDTEPEAIADRMRWLAEKARNRSRIASGKRFTTKIFAVIDEASFTANYSKSFMDDLGVVIRVGRNFGIYLIVAVQDLQVKTMKAEGGAFRSNFRTAFYGSGDNATAQVLFGVGKNELDTYMVGHQGVFLLSAQGHNIIKVRVPLADNEGIYKLLGRPDIPLEDIPVEEYREVDDDVMEPLPLREVTSNHNIPSSTTAGTSDHDKVRAVMAGMRSRGEKITRVALSNATGIAETRVWNIKKEVEATDRIVI